MFDQADAPLRLQQHATLGDSLLALSPVDPLPDPKPRIVWMPDPRVSALAARVDRLEERIRALEEDRVRVRIQRAWTAFVAQCEALWRSLWRS